MLGLQEHDQHPVTFDPWKPEVVYHEVAWVGQGVLEVEVVVRLVPVEAVVEQHVLEVEEEEHADGEEPEAVEVVADRETFVAVVQSTSHLHLKTPPPVAELAEA